MGTTASNRLVIPVIYGVSAIILLFLFWLIYFKEGAAYTGTWVGQLPALNASLNTMASICLLLGLRAIMRRKRAVHMRFMISALIFSALFLISYIVYHHFHGDTPFPGTGWIRPVYFFILISHIVLSVAVVPLILTTLYFAATDQFTRHRRIARFTFPTWLYVSITGVVIFLLLRAYTG